MSLWDVMNHFSVFRFGLLVNELAKLQAGGVVDAITDKDLSRSVPSLTRDALDVVNRLEKFCRGVQFDDCRQQTIWARGHLSEAPTVSVVAAEMDHLKKDLIGEAHKRKFLRV